MEEKPITGGRARIGLVLAAALLAGCNTGSVLDMSEGPTPATGLSGGATGQPAGVAIAAATETPATALAASSGEPADASPLAAAIAGSQRIQFAPVIGATAEAVPALSRRLETSARQRGLAIVTQESTATLVMKGYFSAIADGGKTTVIYVWDVLDPSGNRLHRIQGQQATPGGSGDGWSSVTPATMEAVADATISQLSTWLAGRRG
ncbi:hypothetical protein [Nitratireductor pacificus]|uniref:Lipoprotein n=1 Tax=Nitratireductor pacificus pht-3B TaxID=391937 RepID=K2M8G3_9HYPH|nr:hypothetical protein [Nitratireductor pacificus]EKF17245.1 lipoprotein [Nitratireductor pacificus pht-3B]